MRRRMPFRQILTGQDGQQKQILGVGNDACEKFESIGCAIIDHRLHFTFVAQLSEHFRRAPLGRRRTLFEFVDVVGRQLSPLQTGYEQN